MNLETYYSFPNMDISSICFCYSLGANAPWFDIIIPEGSYHFEDINEFIQLEMRKRNHYDKASNKCYIEISANTKTLTSEMIIKNNFLVDFSRYKSINNLLGFHSKLYTSDLKNGSENMVNILSINIILVNIDIISDSYVNGSTQPTIYSFFPNVSPGYKIIENPHNLLYLPIIADMIHNITIWLTDPTDTSLLTRREFVNAISPGRDFKNILNFKNDKLHHC